MSSGASSKVAIVATRHEFYQTIFFDPFLQVTSQPKQTVKQPDLKNRENNSLFPPCALQLRMNVKSADDIDFAKRGGVIPVVVQDRKTKEVLTLVYANKEALSRTIETGNAWFFSTSRNKIWMKGEESGNIQPVSEILVDCDSDALLYIVNSDKPMCHTGERTCFHNMVEKA